MNNQIPPGNEASPKPMFYQQAHPSRLDFHSNNYNTYVVGVSGGVGEDGATSMREQEHDPINTLLSEFATTHNTTLHKTQLAFVGCIANAISVVMFFATADVVSTFGFSALGAVLGAPCAYDLICNVTGAER